MPRHVPTTDYPNAIKPGTMQRGPSAFVIHLECAGTQYEGAHTYVDKDGAYAAARVLAHKLNSKIGKIINDHGMARFTPKAKPKTGPSVGAWMAEDAIRHGDGFDS